MTKRKKEDAILLSYWEDVFCVRYINTEINRDPTYKYVLQGKCVQVSKVKYVCRPGNRWQMMELVRYLIYY